MFITSPTFAEQVPAPLCEPGSAYWRAFVLSTEASWFLLTHWVGQGEDKHVQTVAVAWESTLLDVVAVVGPESVQSVHWIGRCFAESREWVMMAVSELWLPSKADAQTTGPLLLRIRGEQELRDAFGTHLRTVDEGRQLLLHIGESTSGKVIRMSSHRPRS